MSPETPQNLHDIYKLLESWANLQPQSSHIYRAMISVIDRALSEAYATSIPKEATPVPKTCKAGHTMQSERFCYTCYTGSAK